MASWFMEMPNAFDGKDAAVKGRADLGSGPNGVFVPYVVHTGDTTRLDVLDTEDPMTSPTAQTGKPSIIEPYLYTVAGKSVAMTSVTSAVIVDGRMIGIVGLDMALADLTDDLGALKPFGDGDVMLLSPALNWAAHPDAALRAKPYAETGKDVVAQALRDGRSAQVDGIADGRGAIDRSIVPVRLPALNTNWLRKDRTNSMPISQHLWIRMRARAGSASLPTSMAVGGGGAGSDQRAPASSADQAKVFRPPAARPVRRA